MREQYYNVLNGFALELRGFSNKLSRYHIHESSPNKYGVLLVVSCLMNEPGPFHSFLFAFFTLIMQEST